MPKSHIVKQGECLTTIAYRYGFRDYHPIHDLPANAALWAKRSNPNILFPGDEVVIPDLKQKRASVATGSLHRFQVTKPKKMLRLRLLVHGHEPAEVIDVYAAATPPPETGFDWLAHRQSSFVADLPGADDMRLVGERLRTLRDMHGWTVEQVAVVVGISVRRLERIEAGERPVPLDVMLRLARAFGRPVVELVGETQRPPYYVVQRSASIPSLPSRTRQTPVERPSEPQSKTCQPLAFGFPTRHLFPYFIQLRQAGEDALTHHEHHSHEFIYVLDGELELATLTEGRSVTEVLRPGDACYLDSTVPHLVRGRSRNPYSDTSAAVIDVFWSPLGEDYLFHD